ncbi:tetratricopeptide repeat protein [Nocardia vinacea]|uniref:Tc toxin subunit A-related protein n=1 Tax=Nocardia vinacea TaxID=96468 RepID=UPI002E0E5C90|nr:tetratricopeptide repeat protein [Nocardia vinacea]
MALHEENFLSIRTLHARTSWRTPSRIIVEEPAGSTEIDYRDLLTEANECFFRREYTVALQWYLDLWEQILIQSHPELPAATHGSALLGGRILDATVIDPERIVELSRRHVAATKPGAPIILPADNRRLFTRTEVAPNQALTKFSALTIDPDFAEAATVDALRIDARRLVVKGDTSGAERVYAQQVEAARRQGAVRLAADTLAESGAVLATYTRDDKTSPWRAAALFEQAGSIYSALGDVQAHQAMQANIELLRQKPQGGCWLSRLVGRAHGTTPEGTNAADPPGAGVIAIDDVVRGRTGPDDVLIAHRDGGASVDDPLVLPTPVTSKVFFVPEGKALTSAAAIVTSEAKVNEQARSVGFLGVDGPTVVRLESGQWQKAIVHDLLEPRVIAAPDRLRIAFQTPTTFVAYLTHLFFYVLPLAIAETYAKLGRYEQAVSTYAGILNYPWLNTAYEGADLWQRMASTQVLWGDSLFRRGESAEALAHYEQIVTLPYAVPVDSPLYAPTPFAAASAQAGEVVKDLSGRRSRAVNPKVAEIVTAAARQLLKIDAGLNILGLSDDYVPVLRFTYLQSAANFLADNAIQAARTFIQFRSQAEQQRFERMQLESAVTLNEAAVQVEVKRQEDAALETVVAARTHSLTESRKAHAEANLTDWDTIGRDVADQNAALSYAANAANDHDITYTGVRYQGETHDYSGDVEDFFDVVGEEREWLNFELQRNRLTRAVEEAEAEVLVTEMREHQARRRLEVQDLNTKLAGLRLESSREILDYAENRMFDEDLWFRLASDMEGVARTYLDMAIEAAYVMERAYALEFDRDLHRIRLDYGLGGPESLLGGDQLKQDIASFTIDYIRHAQKQNPIRVAVSMREEFPQAFHAFQSSGVLPFRTDLEIFDRRYPGTVRRKIKRVEVFVEGLIPTNGISGTLQHAGVSTDWRRKSGSWVKHTRVVPEEVMVLSSYQFRRDYAVLRLREEVLTAFENLSPQGNWTLTVWPSANDLDFQSISDITLVLYLDCDVDSSLEEHTRALYDTTGGRSFIRSARLHEPDEYFLLERKRELAFHIRETQLPAWVTDPELTGFTVRLIGAPGAPPIGVRELTITRGSDGASVTANSNAAGTLAGDATTMAPFGAWRHDTPVDTFTVAFAEDDDLSPIVDVQLALSYRFSYRTDPEV